MERRAAREVFCGGRAGLSREMPGLTIGQKVVAFPLMALRFIER